MSHAKEYPRCDTLTEQFVVYHRGTSTEDEVESGEVRSLITNGKMKDSAKKSGDQFKVQNGELGSRGKDLGHTYLNHSSGDVNDSDGELHYIPNGKQENRTLVSKNGHYPQNGVLNGKYEDEFDGHHQINGITNGNSNSNGHHHFNGITNANSSSNGQHQFNGITNGNSDLDEQVNGTGPNSSQLTDPAESHKPIGIPRTSTYLRSSNGIVETDSLTSKVLSELFNDKICVICIKNYASATVCEKLDSFLREMGSEQYTHEIRNNGRADLIYFGVNRYGYPLNSSYNDSTGNNLGRYLSEAMPTIRSIRQAAHPYLSPIDKFRVEMDEAWHKNVNVASLQGQKIFCGIGRIMPASLSELSEVQPHFDAVPISYFPQIHKQFTANFYLNVPETGGELEIWDVPPISIDNIENFAIPENWRDVLPESIKVKPERGDLLMFNTRRPHAITSFGGSNPRTSVQTFIGLAKNSEVFLWV